MLKTPRPKRATSHPGRRRRIAIIALLGLLATAPSVALAQGCIAGIEPQPFALTPIADPLLQIAGDLGSATGPKTVILITDGEESCDGDAARARFRAWADIGGGSYFDATSAAELELSLQQAVSTPPPFEVLDASGSVVATGVVAGERVEWPAGLYSVRILADPVQNITDVRIPGGQEVTLSLTAP